MARTSLPSSNKKKVSNTKLSHKDKTNQPTGLWSKLHNPYIALAVAYLIWGVAAPISKLTLGEIGPFTLLFFRSLITSLILLPLILKIKYTFTLHEQFFVFLAGFFQVFLHIILIYIALPFIPSINLPIIGSMSPFIFVLFSRLFLQEKTSISKYYGMIIGLLGVLCITVLPVLFPPSGDILGLSTEAQATLRFLGLENAGLTSAHLMWLGNGLLVLGVVVGAIGPLFVKRLRHFPGQLLTFWQFALVACFSLPLALWESPSLYIPQITINGALGVLYISVLSSVVAYSLYNNGLQELKAADVGLFSYLAPISALLVGIPLLHEYPDLWFIIGASLVLFGVWVAERKTRRIFAKS